MQVMARGLARSTIFWTMNFGVHGSWSPKDLPPILRRQYRAMPSERVINGGREPHLVGVWGPSERVLEAISKHFNQYLELRMPLGRRSYVWPSYGEYLPIRCPHWEAIDHFQCDL